MAGKILGRLSDPFRWMMNDLKVVRIQETRAPLLGQSADRLGLEREELRCTGCRSRFKNDVPVDLVQSLLTGWFRAVADD